MASQDGRVDEDARKGDPTMLKKLVLPHVDSFNYAVDQGLAEAVKALPSFRIDAREEKAFPATTFHLDEVTIGKPSKNDDSTDLRLYPNECRELGLTYEAPLTVTLRYQVEGGGEGVITKKIGNIPVMVKTSRCHLQHCSREEMVDKREEANEWGGYFICNGNERIVRLIVLPRRNVITALIRPSMQSRGRLYTQFATVIRCVRPDQSGVTVTLHYLSDGSCNLRFSCKKQEFFIPALMLLRCFKPGVTDEEIFNNIVQFDTSNTFLKDRAEMMIRQGNTTPHRTRASIMEHLGQSFRLMLRPEESESNTLVAEQLLNDYMFVHTTKDAEKFDVLVLMVQKLYALVAGKIDPENPDALNSHELLLPGHIYLMILKEKLQDFMQGIKNTILRDLRMDSARCTMTKEAYWRKQMDMQADVGQQLRYFLVTGNLKSNTGLDLMQISGFTIVAEKLNFFRYLSHFRSVHRGQFFTTMKTTTVRKLLPESWGFMCPVHTPDGSPCGLLNHLAAQCEVLTHPPEVDMKGLLGVLVALGMTLAHPMNLTPHNFISVCLDGVVVGRVPSALAASLCTSLRLLKVDPTKTSVLPTLEIAAVLNYDDRVYPMINLATAAARMIRPVYQLKSRTEARAVEWVGPMEQVWMEIAVTDDDYHDTTTHKEIAPTTMLSIIAGLTPFSDFNQSPRNMYQCQMGKQTMGTPFHSIRHRTDNKVYRIQSPQSPAIRNEWYDQYGNDEYPLGTNAVVAVISYTGYDMEDAMIINKGAKERGFGHASVYKYKTVDLGDYRMKGEKIHHRFGNVDEGGEGAKRKKAKKGEEEEDTVKKEGEDELFSPNLDADGLPHVGMTIDEGENYYNFVNDIDNHSKGGRYKDGEGGYVEEVTLLGSEKNAAELQKVGIKFRLNRNPVVGDKFSSRHGQKGVLSVLFPQEDMPFSESGLTPDIIINPHAFPSRMTIGMLIESMAGKSSMINGQFQDATPFQFTEDNTAVEYFGEQLVKAGYAHSGTEVLYSGLTGQEMKVDIFIGCVYYQRLRHMVSDKSQVRSTGPTNALTRQPVKGRKAKGGIRFGEMERDSLLAHGCSFLLHDRLMRCSDYHTTYVCSLCGSLLSPTASAFLGNRPTSNTLGAKPAIKCRTCKTTEGCTLVAVPYVYVYLVNELAAMNIRLQMDVR